MSNIVSLKKSLDDLFSKINDPKGIVPEWTSDGVSEDQLEEVESTLGVSLGSLQGF